jgi:polysaccharide deacetylase family protein (PEP-CTERM system associated)
MQNALTFDVEEYFHVEAFRGLLSQEDWSRLPSRVEASTRQLLDLLDHHRVTATFFVVGWVAERQRPLVREIQARGHELGCHGHLHRPIYAMSPVDFREDLHRGKQAIEDAAGAPVAGYRAPTCSVVRHTLWALDILAEAGFRYDSSVFPIRHDRYGLPDAPRGAHRVDLEDGGQIIEFPMTTVRLAGQNLPFCGGGYFRLLPYRVVAAGIRHLNARDEMPAMVYLHPWEIDPDQPRMKVHGLTRFRQYVGLNRTVRKLERLLTDFSFGPAIDVLRELGLVETEV